MSKNTITCLTAFHRHELMDRAPEQSHDEPMQVTESKRNAVKTCVNSVVVPCSSRKSKLSAPGLKAGSVTAGRQATVARRWREKLHAATPTSPARDLYLGTSLKRALRVSQDLEVPTWIISAGLGLVGSAKAVPSYDLTLAPGAKASISDRVNDVFAPSEWWTELQNGPYACDLTDISGDDSRGRVLICLTRPYAQMIGPALAQLPAALLERLRIFGPGIAAHLPTIVRSRVMRYDQRLDLISPGIQLDAGARALEHFASLIRDVLPTDPSDDQRLIDQALAPLSRPKPIARVRMDDMELRAHIAPWAAEGLSVQGALRRLRDNSHISCEQRRFQRLYDEVRG
ncbi:TPA: hypothetical protein ACOFCG_001522 [Stenotrophomonas maltophilia]|uniref:hypothetical protein n=1 Tax=Stenotrophomonas maltophilia TaxID=40324 RepID=UPI001313C1C9|nr:hypothetical protein [Stenotrophomonas maltophilia]MBN5163563.1 hypothetical protein [Stenotrophomonas maltophilia]